MQAMTVDKPVEIMGKDFFGRNASLSIAPAKKSGWWWKIGEQIDGNDVLIPITSGMIKVRHRRICFEYNGKVLLNIIEHITVLRMMGLDRVILSSKTSWCPHFTTQGLLECMSFKSLDYELGLQKHFLDGTYIKDGRYTTIQSRNGGGVNLFITINYEGLGERQRLWRIREKKDVVKIIRTGSFSQGWPSWYYYVAIFASKYLRWPHLHKFVWPQQHKEVESVLELFITHRALDMLGMMGAMFLVSKQFPSCAMTSFKGGHKFDLLAFQQALNL